MNFWTGDVVELCARFPKNVGLPRDAILPWSPYEEEALLRCYIEQLPEAQRVASLARWDKMPFTPVRFFPPVLLISHMQEISRTPVPFSVEFDDGYFAQHDVPIPTFKAVQYFEEGRFDFDELPRSNVLTLTGKSQHDGKTTVDYLCTYPTTQEDISPPLKPIYGTLRITPNLPEAERNTLPEDLYRALQFFVHPEKERGYPYVF